MRIVGVNGIATHGERSIDVLLEQLSVRGFEVVDVPLPWRLWFSARWGGSADGLRVAKEARDGDVLIAHSFGCLRAWNAHQVREFKAIICIAPAMSRHAEWRYPERVHCYCSPNDWAVRAGAMLLVHPFGAAGLKGFLQPGVTNYTRSCGHSGYFRGELLQQLADEIEQIARRDVERQEVTIPVTS